MGRLNEVVLTGIVDEENRKLVRVSANGLTANVPLVESNPLTGGTTFLGPKGVIPVAMRGDEARVFKDGQPFGMMRSVIKPGRMFSDFSGTRLGVVSAPNTTVTTNYTGYDGAGVALPVQSKTGLPYMTKLDIASDNIQQFEISNANMGSVVTNGVIGFWLYLDMTNKVSGAGQRYLMDVSSEIALYTPYVRVQVTGNQLRHGWNFIAYNQLKDIASMPASEDHFSGLSVTKFSTGANGDLRTNPLKYMQLSFINMNGCSVYLDSLWTGYSALPQVVIGVDQATQDTVDYALPVFDKYGWKGYAACTYRAWASGSKIVSDWNTPAGGTEKTEQLAKAGWDIINHGVNHLPASGMTTPELVRYEIEASTSWLLSRGVSRGTEFYASPQSGTSIQAERIIAECGIKLQRHGLNAKSNINITPFGLDNPNSVGSIDISNASAGFQKFSLIKKFIDNCIEYGASFTLFWHGITTLGDTGTGEDLTGNDLQMTKSAFDMTMAYLKSKDDASLCHVCDGFTGFYYGIGR